MIRGCGCVILGALALAAAAAYFNSSRMLEAAGHTLLRSDPLQKSDVAVVMAGTWVVRAREAAALYQEQWVGRILLTRETPPDGYSELKERGVELPESVDLNQRVLEGLGVPAEAIWRLENASDSTDEEVQGIGAFLRNRGVHRLIVVTSKTHSRRSCMVFDHYLGRDYQIVCRFSRFDPFEPSNWWTRRRHVREFLFEWQKLLMYRLQFALGGAG